MKFTYLKKSIILASLVNLLDDVGAIGAMKVLKMNERVGRSASGLMKLEGPYFKVQSSTGFWVMLLLSIDSTTLLMLPL